MYIYISQCRNKYVSECVFVCINEYVFEWANYLYAWAEALSKK